MKRIALILVTVGILCVTAGQAQAHHPRYYAGRYRGPVVVRTPIVVAPQVVAPVRVYPPVYRPRYYYSAPASGFYYQGPGLSIGVGF